MVPHLHLAIWVGAKEEEYEESYANCLIFHQLIIPIILTYQIGGKISPTWAKKKHAKESKAFVESLMQMNIVMMWQDELYKLTSWLIILL